MYTEAETIAFKTLDHKARTKHAVYHKPNAREPGCLREKTVKESGTQERSVEGALAL